MPDQPNWDFILDAAKKMTDRAAGVNGICLRGKAGWGENMAFLDAMANSFGARWFDEKWNPQFDTPEWKATLTTYLDIMKEAGPQGASGNGFSENLALFQSGKCGMWIDATSAGALVADPKEAPKVADKVGFALAPDKGLGKHAQLAVGVGAGGPRGLEEGRRPREKFISLGDLASTTPSSSPRRRAGSHVPPGTRTSLYANPEYQKAAPFAKATLDSINAADPRHPTVKPVPYTGVQFVAIPEFQGIGTKVGEMFSAALAGQMTADDALKPRRRTTPRPR